jgi:hypothetical protein
MTNSRLSSPKTQIRRIPGRAIAKTGVPKRQNLKANGKTSLER